MDPSYKVPAGLSLHIQSAQVKIITGKYYKRLEFDGTHYENSHATYDSKTLKQNQNVTIYDSVMVTPKLSPLNYDAI